MAGLTLLDVAIAMVFLYLLLSLIASAVNELLAALLQARAKLLEKGIARMLDSVDAQTKLYDHPLLRNLHGQDELRLLKLRRKELPSYIPARNFALALMDTIQPGTGAKNALIAPTEQLGQATAASLLEALEVQPALVPEKVRRALLCLVNAAGGDAARARQNIEDWYNSTMDRVSGAYKRRTQFAIFGIGLIITMAVNADSVAIVRRLASNKTLASAVADSASAYVTAQNAAPPDADGKADAKRADESADQKIGTARQKFVDTLATLDKIGLPIGWTGLEADNTLPPWRGFDRMGPWMVLARGHLAGWFLTAFAISFGAPFWFDVLNRFMVVRSTVKPREKSKEEGSKD